MISDLDKLPALLTVPEAAELLRISSHAAYTMIEHGKLPGAFHRGRRLLIVRDQLVRWVRQAGASPPRRER
jgi:excisionase family DNA binding protein